MTDIPVRRIADQQSDFTFAIKELDALVRDQDLNHALHRHDFYFLLFIQQGEGSHEIDFEAYPICDYSVFFLRPGQVHLLHLKKGASGFLIEFDSAFYTPRENPALVVLRKVSNKNLCVLSEARFEKISSILRFIQAEFTCKQDRYREAIIAHLEVLFIELVRQSPNPDQFTPHHTLYAQEKMDELLGLIEQNMHAKKQVSQYAELLNMTPYQLNSITKATLNKTCSELINDQIILEAKRLLLATNHQVNLIADRLGYHDPSYFIRFFKKHTHFSPEAFRHNFK